VKPALWHVVRAPRRRQTGRHVSGGATVAARGFTSAGGNIVESRSLRMSHIGGYTGPPKAVKLLPPCAQTGGIGRS
jgi:hypothetical protein